MPYNIYALNISTICVVFSYETGSASITSISPVKGACLKWMGFAGKTSLFLELLHSYIYTFTWISLSFAFSKSALPRLPRKTWVNGNTCFHRWNAISCGRLRTHMKQEEVDVADWYSRAFRNYKGKRDSIALSMDLAAHSQFKYISVKAIIQWGLRFWHKWKLIIRLYV